MPETVPPRAATRGFLFADLRGYTAFVEAHGDRAAVALLDAYRALVRAEIARFDGAEIRTEGDSFYVVFPGAGMAVRCGLAILAAARESAAADGRPIPIGIGVHAGEVEETAEGYVGSAVNLAARVCAHARAGELLVTDTVRGILRTSLPVRFDPRGAPSMKGIADRIAVYAVVDGGGAAAPAPGLRRRLLAFGAAALAIALGIVVALTALGPPPAPAPSATVTASASVAASPSAAATFPTSAERALLARLPADISDACSRADLDERPIVFGETQSQTRPLEVEVGVECVLSGGPNQPDRIVYWQARSPQELQDAFFALVQRGAIQEGDCAADEIAHQAWSLGSVEGRVLCRVRDGVRQLVWIYDGTTVMGVADAERASGPALYRWWEETSRLFTP